MGNTLTPSAAAGRALLASLPVRTHNDEADRKSGGTFVHNDFELSAQELYEIWCLLHALRDGAGDAVAVLNDKGSTLVAGTLVRLKGFDDTAGAYEIDPADALPDEGPSMHAEYVLPDDIEDGDVGIAVKRVEVSGLDTSAGSEGDPVYLSDGTSGEWTLTAPALPGVTQIVGYIREAAVSGSVAFAIRPIECGFLTELQDVDPAGRADGDMLIWNTTAKKHVYTSPTDTDEKVKADSGDATAGYLADKVDDTTIEVTAGDELAVKASGIANTHIGSSAAIEWSKISKSGAAPGDVGAAASSHNHNVSDLNAGALALARQSNPAQEAHTAGDTLTNADDRYVMHTNAGTTAEVELTLPDPADGVGPFRFACMDTDGLKIRLTTGFKARVGSSETSAAGYLLSTAIGSALELHPVYDAADVKWKWIALAQSGTWSAA